MYTDWVILLRLSPCSFLYQVFPGTTAQCTRQLLRAARTGEHDTVQKLVCIIITYTRTFIHTLSIEIEYTYVVLCSIVASNSC